MGLRHVFAEIDGLGKIYKGEFGKGNTAKNAVAFGTRYLGKVNRKYKKLFGLIFEMYRHGLAHGHLIKAVRYRDRNVNRFIYWEMTEARDRHLELRKDDARRAVWLVLCVPQLIDDTISAIDTFIVELQLKGAGSRLFQQFRKGYEGTAVVFRTHSSGRGKQLTLGRLSGKGIGWVNQQVR